MTLAEPTTYADTAVQYARDVIAGETVACQWVKLAAERFVSDLDRAENDWTCRFGAAAAAHAWGFI